MSKLTEEEWKKIKAKVDRQELLDTVIGAIGGGVLFSVLVLILGKCTGII